MLILSPYETGMTPKETTWNTTRSASLTAAATTSPHACSLTFYRSSSNTTQVSVPWFLLPLVSPRIPRSFIIHHRRSSHLKITLSHLLLCAAMQFPPHPPPPCCPGRWIAYNFSPFSASSRGSLRLKICDPASFQLHSGGSFTVLKATSSHLYFSTVSEE